MMIKLLPLLVLVVILYTAEGLKEWEVGDEHLKKIFGKAAYDNGDIPNYKVVHAYPREDNSRSRRQVNSNELLYTIESLNQTINLTLSLNSRLFSRSSIIQLYKRDGSLETIDSFPRNCYYFGQVDGEPKSRVAVSLCGDEMVGVLETDEGSYLVEPISGTAHIAYEVQRSPLPEVENIGGSNDEGALPCPKLDDLDNGMVTVEDYHVGSTATYQCDQGFRRVGPRVRRCLPTALWSGNTPVCVPRDPIIISTGETPELLCPELRDPRWGSVRINFSVEFGTYEAVYRCEPGRSLNGGRRRICNQIRRMWSGQEPTCIPDEMLDIYINGLSGSQGQQRKRRQEEGPQSMELMVFVDSGVVGFHGSDIIVNYIMAIMNIMASLYRDATLGTPIDLVISRLIIEEEGETSALNLSEDASTALNTFCQFQFSLNNELESSPLHHDHAILITSVDLCAPDSSGECNSGVIGFAPIGGMCSFTRSCTINEDRGLGTAFVLAHETGHNLGMQHDGFMNDCVGSRRIMAPSASGEEELFLWSSCSADYLDAFLNSGNGVCLNDLPIGGRLNASSLEGVNFDADAQCRAAYGPTARLCPAAFAVEQLCSRLWCQPAIGQNCFTRNVPPADGTSCADNMVCIRGNCEEVDATFIPVDGGWSSFGPYGDCSRTCESGVRYRERQCNNPTPAFGGRPCEGESREYEVCNTDPCPDGTPDFRDVQCAATDGVSFNGRFHAWELFTGLLPPEITPCQLVCQADEGTIVAVRALSVIDGTKCISEESPTAVCIQGACTPLGCDNVLNSDVREDVCGICNGDGSTGTTVNDSATEFGEPGYVEVGAIPIGAREITIRDTSVSSVIALQLGGFDILNGDLEFITPGSYIIPTEDFDFLYNVSSSGVDVAFIDGPLSEQLFIKAFFITPGSYMLEWEYTICDAPSPSSTSMSEPTSTVMTSTTTPSSTVPPVTTTSVTSSTITPVSTTVISQSISSTTMTVSTPTVLIPSTSQELSSTSSLSTILTSSLSTESPTPSPMATTSVIPESSSTMTESTPTVLIPSTSQELSSTSFPSSLSTESPTPSPMSTTSVIPESSSTMTESTPTVLIPSTSQELSSTSSPSTSTTILTSSLSTGSPTPSPMPTTLVIPESSSTPSVTSSSSSITTFTLIETSTSVVTSQVTSSTFIPQSTSIVQSTSSSISTTTSSTTSVRTSTPSFSTTSVPETTTLIVTPSNTPSSSNSATPSTTTIISTSSAPSSSPASSTTTAPSSAPPITTITSTSAPTSTTSTAPTTTPSPDPTPMDCITYDLCGVCNGDNSSARIVTGSFSQSGDFGYYDVVTIPTGARHIMVYEDPSTTDNFIALSVNGISILNGQLRIKSSTVFTDANGVAFTYIRSPQESVSTTGPLSQPLTVQALIAVSRGTYSLSWSYVMCNNIIVTPTSSSSTMTPTTSSIAITSSSTPTPTPEVLFALWSSTRYGSCSLNDEGECLRSREVFCQDGLTGAPLSDDLCAARRRKPSTTLRCGARFCQ